MKTLQKSHPLCLLVSPLSNRQVCGRHTTPVPPWATWKLLWSPAAPAVCPPGSGRPSSSTPHLTGAARWPALTCNHTDKCSGQERSQHPCSAERPLQGRPGVELARDHPEP